MRREVRRLFCKGRSVMILLSSISPIVTFSSNISVSICPAAAMSNSVAVLHTAAAEQKRALRSRSRRELRSMTAVQRTHEDNEIQKLVLDSLWFKSAKRLCAYVSCEALREVDTTKILSECLSSKNHGAFVDHLDHHAQVKKRLYVPRVEDKNSNMSMLEISRTADLVANSMNILEPSPIDANGNEREDVMLASEPVDIILLPGLAFDRQGHRLGRGGGYYDAFIQKYQELAKERKWKQPLRIALAYSAQIMEENVIPVTPTDLPVDALVSPSGVIPISPVAYERMM